MRAGQLNVRGVLQRPAETPDGMGGADVAWQDIATLWMRLVPGEGKEFWVLQHSQPMASHVITIRYRTGVTAQMRIRANGRTYRIVAPPMDVDHKHEMLELTCAEHAEGA